MSFRGARACYERAAFTFYAMLCADCEPEDARSERDEKKETRAARARRVSDRCVQVDGRTSDRRYAALRVLTFYEMLDGARALMMPRACLRLVERYER